MILFPAVDIYDGCAVRLLRGDYRQMTVYDRDPVAVARRFREAGATHIHVVDLEGARDGVPHAEAIVSRIIQETGLSLEIGGGIRSVETVERYLDAGADHVILGTAAVSDPAFLAAAADRFAGHIAVGADLKDGRIAVRGWTATSDVTADALFADMIRLGVRRVICTDITRDGAMKGTNRALYETLASRYDLDFIASGGVSSLDDVRALRDIGLFGAIIGRAYYTGAIRLEEALRECMI